MTHGLLVSTKHMTAFTYEYLPLVSDYSWVLNTRQDSFASICHSSVITHEYIRCCSNATSHARMCTGLPAHVCKHVTRYVWWSTCESHLLYMHVTEGAAHMHVLLEWIQTCYSYVCVTRMYDCTCNTSTFYKTFKYVIMYIP